MLHKYYICEINRMYNACVFRQSEIFQKFYYLLLLAIAAYPLLISLTSYRDTDQLLRAQIIYKTSIKSIIEQAAWLIKMQIPQAKLFRYCRFWK